MKEDTMRKFILENLCMDCGTRNVELLVRVPKMRVRPVKKLSPEERRYYDRGAEDMKLSILSLFAQLDTNNK